MSVEAITTSDQESQKRTGTKPFAGFEWMLAARYLRSRRKEAFISVIAGFSFLGIMLGVATLIIVMAVMNGFRTELLDRILGLNGHLIVNPVDGPLVEYESLSERLEKIEGVRLALPLVEGQALVNGNTGAGTGALVRGLREEDLEQVLHKPENVLQGTLEGFDISEGVAIGSRLAQNLGLFLGDEITLISPDGDVTAFGTTPRVKNYPIVAVFEIGMSEYDASFIFMPLEESQLYFNREGIVDVIDIFIDDADQVDEFRLKVENAAQRSLWLQDWRQRNSTLFSALEVERNVMFMILTLIVLVATLNIISGLIMLVKDKSHDIAIMRTMGMSRASIMRVFMITGSAIGIVGTIAGVIIGVLVSLNIKAIQDFLNWATGTEVWDSTVRFLSDIPAEMDLMETVMIVVMALVLSFLATLFPAWRAAKLDPVEALRYE